MHQMAKEVIADLAHGPEANACHLIISNVVKNPPEHEHGDHEDGNPEGWETNFGQKGDMRDVVDDNFIFVLKAVDDDVQSDRHQRIRDGKAEHAENGHGEAAFVGTDVGKKSLVDIHGCLKDTRSPKAKGTRSRLWGLVPWYQGDLVP